MMQIDRPQHVDERQLAELLEQAASADRRRSHILLHADHQDQVQRLLIGLEPDSYVRPHVHSEQWEMLVLLHGRLDVLIFSPQAELLQRLAMSVEAPVVQIPRNLAWRGGTVRKRGHGGEAGPLSRERICRLGARGRRGDSPGAGPLGRLGKRGGQMVHAAPLTGLT
jgi:cupin fold WbuC family metalloprotein